MNIPGYEVYEHKTDGGQHRLIIYTGVMGSDEVFFPQHFATYCINDHPAIMEMLELARNGTQKGLAVVGVDQLDQYRSYKYGKVGNLVLYEFGMSLNGISDEAWEAVGPFVKKYGLAGRDDR